MLSKDSRQNTSYSFEQLLGWFGKFTPQFKFRLMSMRRQMDPIAFDNFIRETLGVFRAFLVELSRAPKGPERAKKMFTLLEEEYRTTPVTGVSCSVGCSACCRSFAKQITDDEADLLASLVKSGTVTIDLDKLNQQANELRSEDPELRKKAELSPCPFIGENNRCTVYADRPSVCRKYYVTSPAANCSTKENVIPRIDLMPELIVSASMSLPDNGFGIMHMQLADRIFDQKAKEN